MKGELIIIGAFLAGGAFLYNTFCCAHVLTPVVTSPVPEKAGGGGGGAANCKPPQILVGGQCKDPPTSHATSTKNKPAPPAPCNPNGFSIDAINCRFQMFLGLVKGAPTVADKTTDPFFLDPKVATTLA